MDTHHPKAVFVMIGVFQSLALFTALGLGTKSPRPCASEAVAAVGKERDSP